MVCTLLPRQAEVGLWLFLVGSAFRGPGSWALLLPRMLARSLGFCSHRGTALLSLWRRPSSEPLENLAQVNTVDGVGSSLTILKRHFITSSDNQEELSAVESQTRSFLSSS